MNLCTLAYGLSVGWYASAFLLYDSDDSPLPSGRVGMEEIAWIGSILGIGGLVGTVALGWIADRVGRKNSLLALAVPQIVSIFNNSNNKNTRIYLLKMIYNSICTIFFFFLLHTDQLFVNCLCTKCLLLICVAVFGWFRWWWCVRCSSNYGG